MVSMKSPTKLINLHHLTIALVVILAVLTHRSQCAPAVEEDDVEGGCYYMFNHYGEGDRILTNEPCLNCTCHNSMLMCYLRVCPFTKPIGQDCTIEKKPDQCCPVISCPQVPVSLVTPSALVTTTSTTTAATVPSSELAPLERGCEMDGKYYADGAQVASDPSKPCELCYCIRNRTACVMQECILHVEGCRPVFEPGVCCPVRYQCDAAIDFETTTTTAGIGGLISTTISSILGGISSTPLPGGCVKDGEYYADGSQIPNLDADPCNHCYCMRGDIVCAVQECGSPLENEGGNCTAIPPRAGLCCPEQYACHGPPRQGKKIFLPSNESTESPEGVTGQTGVETVTESLIIGSTPSQVQAEPVTVIPGVDQQDSSSAAPGETLQTSTESNSLEAEATTVHVIVAKPDGSVPEEGQTSVPSDSLHDETEDQGQGTTTPRVSQTSPLVISEIFPEQSTSQSVGGPESLQSTTSAASSTAGSVEPETTTRPEQDQQEISEKVGTAQAGTGAAEPETTHMPEQQPAEESSPSSTGTSADMILTSTPSGIKDEPEIQTSVSTEVPAASSSSVPQTTSTEILASTPLPQQDESVTEADINGVQASSASPAETSSASELPAADAGAAADGQEHEIHMTTPREGLEELIPTTLSPSAASESSPASIAGQTENASPSLQETTSEASAAPSVANDSTSENEATTISSVPSEQESATSQSSSSTPAASESEPGKPQTETTVAPGEKNTESINVTTNLPGQASTSEASTASAGSEPDVANDENESATTVASIEGESKDTTSNASSSPAPTSETSSAVATGDVSQSADATTVPPPADEENNISSVSADAAASSLATERIPTTAVVGGSEQVAEITTLRPQGVSSDTKTTLTHSSSTEAPSQETSLASTQEPSAVPPKETSAAPSQGISAEPAKETSAAPSQATSAGAQGTTDGAVTVQDRIQAGVSSTTKPVFVVENTDDHMVIIPEQAPSQQHIPVMPLQKENQTSTTIGIPSAEDKVGSAQPSTSEASIPADEHHDESENSIEGDEKEHSSAPQSSVPVEVTTPRLVEQGAIASSSEAPQGELQEASTIVSVQQSSPPSVAQESSTISSEQAVTGAPQESAPVAPEETASVKPEEGTTIMPQQASSAAPIEPQETSPAPQGGSSQAPQAAVAPAQEPVTVAPGSDDQAILTTSSGVQEEQPATTSQPELSTDAPIPASSSQAPESTSASAQQGGSSAPAEQDEPATIIPEQEPSKAPASESEGSPTATSPSESGATSAAPSETESGTSQGPTEIESATAEAPAESEVSPAVTSQAPSDSEIIATTQVPSEVAPSVSSQATSEAEASATTSQAQSETDAAPAATSQAPSEIESAPAATSQAPQQEEEQAATTSAGQPEPVPVTTSSPDDDDTVAAATSTASSKQQSSISSLPDLSEQGIATTGAPQEEFGVTTIASAPKESPAPAESHQAASDEPAATTSVPQEKESGATSQQVVSDEPATTSPTAVKESIPSESQESVSEQSVPTTSSPVEKEPATSVGQQSGSEYEPAVATTEQPQATNLPAQQEGQSSSSTQEPDETTVQIGEALFETTVASAAKPNEEESGATIQQEQHSTSAPAEEPVAADQTHEEDNTETTAPPSQTSFAATSEGTHVEEILTSSPASIPESVGETTATSAGESSPSVGAASETTAVPIAQAEETTVIPIASQGEPAGTTVAAQEQVNDEQQGITSPSPVEVPTTVRDESSSSPSSESGSTSAADEVSSSQGVEETTSAASVSVQDEASMASTSSSLSSSSSSGSSEPATTEESRPSVEGVSSTESSESQQSSSTENSISSSSVQIASDETVEATTAGSLEQQEVATTTNRNHLVTSNIIGSDEGSSATTESEEIVLTDAPGVRIPGEGSCFVEGVSYKNGSHIPPSTPCQITCACQNSIVHCLLYHCAPPPSDLNCKPIYQANVCCPEYDCEVSSTAAPVTILPEASPITQAPEGGESLISGSTSAPAESTSSSLSDEVAPSQQEVSGAPEVITAQPGQPQDAPVISNLGAAPTAGPAGAAGEVVAVTTPQTIPVTSEPSTSVHSQTEVSLVSSSASSSQVSSVSSVSSVNGSGISGSDITTRVPPSATQLPGGIEEKLGTGSGIELTIPTTSTTISPSPSLEDLLSTSQSPATVAAAQVTANDNEIIPSAETTIANASSVTTAGSKYPVTTTTTVTASPATWPYPSSSTMAPSISSGACLFDGRVYMSAQQIPRDDPCDFCFCFRGDIICLQQSCPPPIPGCYEEPIPGFCCPRYECPVGSGNSTTTPPLFPPSYYHGQIMNGAGGDKPVISSSQMASGPGCEIQGEYYETGQVIMATSGPCLECRCGSTGMMECDPRECQPEPMLRKMIAAISSR